MNATLAARWRWWEAAFWALAVASLFVLPDYHLLLNEVAITGLFALSLDLILGYAGIISLGHAAFFGFGAYLAGLLTRWGLADPLAGLAVAALASAALGFATSFLVLRGTDLTRIMVTLGVSLVLLEAANRAAWLTGGADGMQGLAWAPLLGRWPLDDLYGTIPFAYSLAVLFVMFLAARGLLASPFGWSLRALRGNPLRAAAIGIPVRRRLVAIYSVAALYAGVAGALLAQTTQFVSLDVLAFHRSADLLLMLVLGGVGWLYGGLVGALVFKVMQDALAALTPEYWQFWVGFLLVVLVLVGRDRIGAWPAALRRRLGR